MIDVRETLKMEQEGIIVTVYIAPSPLSLLYKIALWFYSYYSTCRLYRSECNCHLALSLIGTVSKSIRIAFTSQ